MTHKKYVEKQFLEGTFVCLCLTTCTCARA